MFTIIRYTKPYKVMIIICRRQEISAILYPFGCLVVGSFQLFPPALVLAPARQIQLLAQSCNQFNAFAASVMQQVQVCGEMDIGLQHIGINADV